MWIDRGTVRRQELRRFEAGGGPHHDLRYSAPSWPADVQLFHAFRRHHGAEDAQRARQIRHKRRIPALPGDPKTPPSYRYFIDIQAKPHKSGRGPDRELGAAGLLTHHRHVEKGRGRRSAEVISLQRRAWPHSQVKDDGPFYARGRARSTARTRQSGVA
jgi:hypothetical protein